MRSQGSTSIDPILERTFGWLRHLGYAAAADPHKNLVLGATFSSDAVVVRASFEWLDEYADVTVARRWASGLAPYWAQVHLYELLERAGHEPSWREMANDRSGPDALEEVFARGAALLRQVAPDQLAGRNLEVLDDIIAGRPRRGVPGIDFPSTEPWFATQEGLWFPAGIEPPATFADAINASHSADAATRAAAAFRLHRGLARGKGEPAKAYRRLEELLADPDLDVRRAAASTLSVWGEPWIVGPILDLLDQEAGDLTSPFAAAATFLAIGQPSELRERVRDALDRFASRGDAAQRQVADLRWRLDDHPPRYPRVIQLWRKGDE